LDSTAQANQPSFQRLLGDAIFHIDADIATDKTAPYDWNGIRVIDTPGLFTDRADHDEITYEAIAKADLLVFCLTYMLSIHSQSKTLRSWPTTKVTAGR
jgi:predicted GTPase